MRRARVRCLVDGDGGCNDGTASSENMHMDSEFMWTCIERNGERKEGEQEECANEHAGEDPRHRIGVEWTGGNQTKLTCDCIERESSALLCFLCTVAALCSPSIPRISFP
jgi:hypothetical protein